MTVLMDSLVILSISILYLVCTKLLTTNKVSKVLVVDRNDNDEKIVYNYSDNSNYALEELQSGDHDLNLIKKCFSTKLINFDKFASCKEFTMKVYRVLNRKSGDTSENKSNNFLLFHGTSAKSAVGILEKGFKPSNKGLYGPGVYLTASSSSAMEYSRIKGQKSDKKKEFVVLVNEVLHSVKLKEVHPSDFVILNFMSKILFAACILFLAVGIYIYSVKLACAGIILPAIVLVVHFCYLKFMLKKHSNPRKNRFERYIYWMSMIKSSVDYFETDSRGRRIKICDGSAEDNYNHFVCDEKLVVPRYLIDFTN